jgi:large repetitive protein
MFHAIRHPLFLFICFLGFVLNLQAAVPTWSVDASQYQYSMIFNAQVVLDGASAPQGNHVVGVFVGNQCRGLASPMEANGKSYYFLTVYANQSSGETLTFKFYNAGTDQLYTSPTTQVFQRNASIGGVANPLSLLFAAGNDFPIVFTSIPKQTTISGTNFTPLNLSNYLNQIDQDQLSWQALPSAKLNASLDANGTLEVSPIVPHWTGIDSIRVVATETGPYAYKDTVIVYFQILPFTQISLSPLPIQQIGPDDTFKSYDVDQYLTPAGNCQTYSLCQIPLKGNEPAPNWMIGGGGAGSMTINAKVRFGGKEQSTPGSQLAVFINNELRGVASPLQSGGSFWYFLTVNNGAAGPITFKYYDPANQYLYTCASTLNFVSNTTAGTIMDPQVVNLEPLDIQINANGILTANIINADWLGTQFVEIIAINCTYSDTNRDTVFATFIIDPNDTGKPTIFSVDSTAFTEASCLPLYDANAFDQINDEGQGLSYSIIGGADSNAFTLESQTGKLDWKQLPDFETPHDADLNNLYEVWIEVRDADQKADSLSLKIRVLDNPSEVFTASIQSSGFMCGPNQKTVLSVSAGQNFLWSTGSDLSEIYVDKVGTYSTTVTNTLGCKDTAVIQVAVIARNLSVNLDKDCQFTLTPDLVSIDNCANIRVMDNNPSNGNIIDCAGVWTYGLFDAYGELLSWGTVTAEDKSAPAIVCTNWQASPLICNDVNEVLNNPLSIGNAYGSPVETMLSPAPSKIDPSRHTIVNAEGVAGVGAQNCDLAPPNLLNSGVDKVRNVGYTYFSDNCQTGACACRTTLKWSDRVVYYGCDSINSTGTYARIFRTWVGTDCNGYAKDTTQEIRFVRPRAAFGTVASNVQTDGQNTDFQFNGGNTVQFTSCQTGTTSTQTVAGYDRVVEYDACGKDYSKIKWQDVSPYVVSPLTGKRKYLVANNDKTQVPADSTLECSYSLNVTDVEFPICNGGVKIDRTITVLDWCAGKVVKTWKVLIKIGDFKAPVISKIQNPVLSTNAADCTASFNLSAAGIKTAFGVTISDNCAASPLVSVKVKSKYHYIKGILTDTTTWREEIYPVLNNRISGLGLGPHRLILDVTDNCENCVRDSFEFVVKDQIAPLMKCDDQIRVSLSRNFVYGGDTGPEAIGYAQVSAQDLDEGSTDNCQIRWIQVRRSIGQDCIANFIKKGYDTNGDGKLTPRNKPYVESPGASVDADKVDGFDRNGDGDIADFGEAFETINGVLFSPLQDQVELFCCDVLQSPTVELWGEDIYGNRNYCWTTLSVEDKIAPTCQAPQDLTLDCDDKCLTWLAAAQHETQADACFGGTANLSNGGECGNVQKAYSVEAVKGKCGIEKYLRKWTFIKKTGKGDLLVTCTQTIYLRNIHEYSIRFPKDASVNCLQTLSPDSVRVAELGCDVLAVNASDKRYAASGDECYKVFRTYTVINWCAYNDQCGDPVQNVHVVPRSIFDNYGKNDLYVLVRDEDRDTEESFWYSRDSIFNQNTDLSFVPTVPGTGSNQCEGEYYHAFQYTQILKVYDNERPVVSGKTQEACIREDANCLAIVDLTVKVEDNCTAGKIELETPQMSVELLQDPNSIMPYQPNRWTITPLTLGSGLKLTEGIAPAEFKIRINGLPQGKHNLVVVARDECGNLSTATRIPFEVKDCKGPAPICINGLSTTLQADGQGGGNATVWATDFVASKVYDCNGQGPESQQGLKLVTHYSINRVGDTALPGQNKLVLNCEDAKLALIQVEIHAWDTQGNHDFCVSFIEVQSNQDACQSTATAGQISGIITTDDAEPFAGVGVELSGGAALKRTTNSAGSYSFLNLTTAKDYTLSVQLDENPLNGVSTLDLIHMVRHILGVKKLSNPYRLIAADVNNSQSITTLDLVQIRKMILGLETKFSAVPSWRFVDAGYSFPVPSDPWSASFPEVININDLQGKIRADFIAIKMGDVNGTALVNGLGNAEVRTSGQLKLNTQEQSLKMGAEYRVAFTADDLQNIQGYQFALSLDQSKVELLDIEYGVAKAENFGIFKNEGLITTSWNGKYESGALFTLVLRAKAEAKLSSALSLNRRVSSEAYNQHNENLGIALNYGLEAIAEGYELLQNTPNPFSDETQIGFKLPKATKATLSVSDAKGALLYKVEGSYPKGNNQLTLKKAQLGASGVLYYTLETNDFTATKKMIIVE